MHAHSVVTGGEAALSKSLYLASRATPVTNRPDWKYSAAHSEFEPIFLSGLQRSVNRNGPRVGEGTSALSVLSWPRCDSTPSVARFEHGYRLPR
jgi:hypothetical protein